MMSLDVDAQTINKTMNITESVKFDDDVKFKKQNVLKLLQMFRKPRQTQNK
jgi:hypothetical protein